MMAWMRVVESRISAWGLRRFKLLYAKLNDTERQECENQVDSRNCGQGSLGTWSSKGKLIPPSIKLEIQ